MVFHYVKTHHGEIKDKYCYEDQAWFLHNLTYDDGVNFEKYKETTKETKKAI